MKIKNNLKKVKQKLSSGKSSSDGESDPDNKNKDDDSDNDSTKTNKTSGTSKSSKGSKGESSGESGESDFSDNGENDESEIELLPDDGKNFGKRKLQDTDKMGTWNVLVRVIEAKDVNPGAARVRSIFDGKSKMTRTVTHAIPKWRQNLLYTKNKVTLESLASKILTLKLVRPTKLGETSIGEFSCYLSEVIHSPNRSVVAKWIALGFPGEDDEEPDDYAFENCGFLKVTISVYRIDESPPQLIDDDGKEQIWSGAHLNDYTLKIRLFSLEDLLRKILNQKITKKKQKFYVTVQCGGHKTETTQETAILDNDDAASVRFEQEIYIPIQWPTVISEIIFTVYSKRGRKNNCIGKATIPMRKIYEPGENGFLPTFGPAYINVFDCERVTRFSLFSRKAKGAQQDGSRFIGRLFLTLDCVEFMGESSAQRMHLDHSSIMVAESVISNTETFNAFCSMSALNKINPQFGSDPICVMMSIGPYGSMNSDVKFCSSSTLPAEPNYDGCTYFAMPWGNLRPVAEVVGQFESIDHRIEMSNVLMKMTNMLDKMIWEVRRIGNGAIDHVASVGIETLNVLDQMISSISTYLQRVKPENSNDLDRNILTSRKSKILKLREHFEAELYNVDYSDEEVDTKLLRKLLQMRSLTYELAEDVQLSIPPVIIKLMSEGKLIGFAKIPISEIYQSSDSADSGEWCGKTRPINIQWPTLLDQRNRKKEYVAVLHAKMWFGKSEHLSKWENHVQPAEVRRFMEIYEIQKKGLTLKWKDTDSELLDGDGKKITDVPSFVGWRHVGNWILMNTRAMYVTQLGHETVHDKAKEIQKKSDKGRWEHFKYTDYAGNELQSEKLLIPKGSEVSPWVPDKFRNKGDEKGWIYSTHGTFFMTGAVIDQVEKPHHNYRIRWIKRSRKLTSYNKDLEKFDKFKETVGDDNWEFTKKKGGPYHDGESGTDHYRRRRYIQEYANTDKSAVQESFRLYEYQMQTTKWQLRCYIMWANDLLPVVKNSARAFVRVSFAHQTKQTLVVDNSSNPIWNETIMFRSMLISGGIYDIMRYPPVVSVEVIGECSNNEEANLGVFETTPVVICSNTDNRGTAQWFPLRFSKGRTRGTILACFELYQEEDKDLIPLEPGLKHNAKERREIPSEFRPEFDKYHIQFLCWGVRNLKKHKLLSVRRPFVELMIGDQEFTLEPLKDVRKNPNFPEPMIAFEEVILPSALELSPPFIINLFDARSFNRKPLVGSCLISDLHKYISHIIPKTKSNQAEKWDQLQDIIIEEHEKIVKMIRVTTLTVDPMVPLDWWSRYYASMSQFHRSPGFPESGMEYLRIFRRPVEEMNGYNHFTDFLDTFPFVKSIKGDFDDPEEKEKAGELKCRLLISKIKKGEAPATINPVVDFIGPTECLVRVYVIEATGLITNARKGRVDSYVKLQCGKQKVNLKKNYRAECCDPIFGERVDMLVTIPLEKDLKITVMDKRRILSDQEIGSTTIDLENRLLTKWRATCGLSGQYTVQGEQQWRDQMTPLEILKSYCYKMMLSTPTVTKRKTEKGEEHGIIIEKITFWYSEVLIVMENDETAMLNAQRQKAGKEGNGNSVRSEDDKSPDSWDDIDLEMEKEKANWERQRNTEKRPKKASQEKAETAEGEVRKSAKQRIMGTELETIALFILRQINLVPEHVESRPLFSDKCGLIQKGELRMFVDIFPKEYGSIPAPFNISPRKPVSYQLRIAVMDVRGAIPVKRSFAEPVSDLYVKAFINGMTKGHKTDTHFRVLDGTGEFNWRFLLNFDYNPWEKKVVSYTKTRFFRKPVEELVDPILVIELWDKNKFRKDRLLGDIELDLLEFIEGIGSPSEVGVYSTKKRKRRVKCPKCCTSRGCLCRCCIFCFETKCLCGRRKVKKKPFPKPVLFVEPEGYDETVNIFEARNLYGWWPMLTEEYPHDEPQNAKKKNDDIGKDPKWIMGLIEMDMMLLTKQEADQEPAGKKRSEPNHSPFLEKPNRKTWANSWLVSRIKPCIKYFWHYYGLQILLWILIIALLVLTIFALIQTWPIILLEIFKSIF